MVMVCQKRGMNTTVPTYIYNISTRQCFQFSNTVAGRLYKGCESVSIVVRVVYKILAGALLVYNNII